MAKRYRITWEVGSTQAEAAARRVTSEFGKAETAANKAAAAMTKAFSAGGGPWSKGGGGGGGGGNGAAAAAKQAQAAVAAKQQSVDQLARIEDRYLLREYAGRVAHQARLTKNDEKAAANLDAMQDRLLKRDYDRRVRFEARKANAADRAAKQQTAAAQRAAAAQSQAFDRSVASAAGLTGALTTVGAAFAGIQIGAKIVQEIAAAFHEAKAAAKQMAEDTLATLAALREIASIKGKGAPEGEDLEQHLKIREASGLTGPEAESYENQLLNALGAVSKERFGDDQRGELAVRGAQVAGRRGGGPAAVKARAMVHGLLPNYMPKGSSAKDVVSKAEQIDDILGLGTGTQEVSTAQYQELLTGLTSEKLSGFLHDPAQAAGLNAIASQFGDSHSATSVVEAVRGVSSLTKEAKAKGAKSTQAQTLKEAGITEFQDPEERMRKLFQYADKNFKGEAFDVALARRGFRNTTDNRRLAQFYETYQKGDFDRIMALTHGQVDPNLVGERQKAFEASDVGQKLIAQQGKEAAKLRKGQEHVPLEIAKDRAEKALIEEGIDDTTMGNLRKKAASAATLGGDGRDVLAEDRAMQDLRAQAGQPRKGIMRRIIETAVGVSPYGQLAGEEAGRSYDYMTSDHSAEAKELREAIERNTKALEAQNGGPRGAPAPVGGPPPARVRP